MPVPNHPAKYDSRAHLTPEADLAEAGIDVSAPPAVVLTFQDDFFAHVVEEHGEHDLPDVGGGARVVALSGTGGTVGVAGEFGAGAPITAAVLETLIAQGTEVTCVVGGCGGLGDDLARHETVVVDRAVRDEGTSHHYLPDERYARATSSVVDGLTEALAGRDVRHRVGPSWTTDAIYRETEAELEQYRGEGVLTVEMEAAAVFAVARFRGVEAGAVLRVFDRLLDDDWEGHADGTVAGLRDLLPPVRDALSTRVAD